MNPHDPRQHVDPSLHPLLDQIPPKDFSLDTLVERRAEILVMLQGAPPEPGAAEAEEHHVPGPDSRGTVRVLVWRSPGAAGKLPAVLEIHGGGYVVGEAGMSAAEHRSLVAATPCVVVSVDYGLAPESAHPALIEECYAALVWMAGNADALGIDAARIGVRGVSAGGGLAAALALLARDRGEIPLAFQHLCCPMLDDRTCTHPEPNPHAGHFIWTRASNHFGWASLLGTEPGGEGVSPYAAPARAESLAGLPPTYIGVGSVDLFIDENLEYARRLIRAGVPVELHVYPGGFHGFEMAPDSPLAQQARRDHRAALVRALGG